MQLLRLVVFIPAGACVSQSLASQDPSNGSYAGQRFETVVLVESLADCRRPAGPGTIEKFQADQNADIERPPEAKISRQTNPRGG